MNRLLLTSLITAAFVAVTGPALATDNSGGGVSNTTGNSGATNSDSPSGSRASSTTGSSGSGSSGSGSNSSGTDTSASSDQDIYGSEIMTPAERAEFRAKMQSAKTSQERERLRVDHQAAMQSRAKQRGITLPDDSASQSPDSGMGSGGTP